MTDSAPTADTNGVVLSANPADTALVPSALQHRWIWVVTGPTASGKTGVGKALASDLSFPFIEGDDYHPKANVQKMARNEPLTDADRAGWLQALRQHETSPPAAEGHKTSPHLVMTCSALKRAYRDVLRLGDAGDVRVRFVFLDAPEEVLTKRAAERKGHYAGPGLLKSQFEALERPAHDETDVSVVSTVDKSVEDTKREVCATVREVMGREDGAFLRVL